MTVQVKTAEGDAVRKAISDAGSNPLDGKTVAQLDAYIDANVATLAQARAALKLIVRWGLITNKRLDRIEKVLDQT